jgi:hypothetical protein
MELKKYVHILDKNTNFMIDIICLTVMLIQIVYVTEDYFKYPFDIKLNVLNDQKTTIPSISLCTSREFMWTKTFVEQNYPEIYNNILLLKSEYESCNLFRNNNHIEYNNKVFDKRCVEYFLKTQKLSSEINRKFFVSNDFNPRIIFEISESNFTIDCKVKTKNSFDEKSEEIECKSINKIFEFIDRSRGFGRCWVYFNQLGRKLSNDSKPFCMKKSDSIELELNKKYYNEIIGALNIYNRNHIYISIHSPNSLRTDSTFNQISSEIIGNGFYDISFRKSIYKTLHSPHSTDCYDYENQNSSIHSFSDCMEDCLLNENISGSHSFWSIIGMNHNISSLNETNFIDQFTDCRKNCKRTCNEDKYFCDIDYKGNQKNQNVKIHLRFKSLTVYKYEAIAKFPFISYLVSIGSLMSLWLGISSSDSYIKIKILLKVFGKILMRLYLYFEIRGISFKVKQVVNIFFKYFLKFYKIDFEKLTMFLCLCCFTKQFIELLALYLKFETILSVKFESYQYPNGVMPTDNLPAFSICTQKIISSQENLDNYLIQVYNHNLSHLLNKPMIFFSECMRNDMNNTFLFEKCYNQLKKKVRDEKNISRFLKWIDNLFLRDKCNASSLNEDLNEIIVKNKNFNDINCIENQDIVMTVSALGKCYTFFSYMNKNSQKIGKNKDFEIFERRYRFFNESYYLLYHDRNQLPSFASTDDVSNYYSEYSINKFYRLEPPYDTQCYDYSKDKMIKSKGQCINDCIIKATVNEFGCVPLILNKITLSESISKNLQFCNFSQITSLTEEKCKKQCLIACEETIFNRFFSKSNKIMPIEEKFISYNYEPKMTFMYFLSTIGGLIGLWCNISLFSLYSKFSHLVEDLLRITLNFLKLYKMIRLFEYLMSKVKLKARNFLF